MYNGGGTGDNRTVLPSFELFTTKNKENVVIKNETKSTKARIAELKRAVGK